MSVKGKERVDRILRAMTDPANRRLVEQALFVGASEIAVEAQLSINRGSVSGKGHVPSAPGDPPNRDTGVLSGNIEALQEGPLRAIASSNASYSQPLEFGTSKMAARPFMRPAAAKVKPMVQKLVAQAISKAIRGGR